MTNMKLQIKCVQDLLHDTTIMSTKHNRLRDTITGETTSPEEDTIALILDTKPPCLS